MPTASNWTTRVWREYRAGNLTRAFRDVLLTLATYRGDGGLICPAHATLAERAKTCVRTVQRALQHARDLGLVTWAERRARAAWRWLRQSNAYRLVVPDTSVEPGSRPIWWRRATTRQFARGGESTIQKEPRNAALAALLADAARLPDLLAARRAAMETRMRAAAR